MLSFFPRDVLDEILDAIESVSEGFPTYFRPAISQPHFFVIYLFILKTLISQFHINM